MQAKKIFVNNEAKIFWDSNPDQSIRRFIKSIDNSYLEDALADEFVASDLKDPGKFSEYRLRQALFTGLEHMFALLFASLQAHAYPIGWLLLYRNSDLRELITKVLSNEPIPVMLMPKVPGFYGYVRALILQCKWADDFSIDKAIAANAKAMEYLAKQFVSHDSVSEYNSIKHGSRHKFGGFGLQFTPKNRDSPKSYEMKEDHGVSLFEAIDLKEQCAQRATHYQTITRNISWDPLQVQHKILFISKWIRSIQSLMLASQEKGSGVEVDVPGFDLCEGCLEGKNSLCNVVIRETVQLPDSAREKLDAPSQKFMWPSSISEAIIDE